MKQTQLANEHETAMAFNSTPSSSSQSLSPTCNFTRLMRSYALLLANDEPSDALVLKLFLKKNLCKLNDLKKINFFDNSNICI